MMTNFTHFVSITLLIELIMCFQFYFYDIFTSVIFSVPILWLLFFRVAFSTIR